MNAHYEKGRYFVPRRVPGEETVFEPEDEVQSYINQQFVMKGCQLVHCNVLSTVTTTWFMTSCGCVPTTRQ
jgi:hypothetical protein